MGVEVLLVVRGQTQALEPTTPGVHLRLLHQRPAEAPPPLRLGHHHGLHEEAVAAFDHAGEPGVAHQCLAPPDQHQTDGEARAGLPEGVEAGGHTPLPLGIHQVSARHEQVRALVEGDGPDSRALLLLTPSGWPPERERAREGRERERQSERERERGDEEVGTEEDSRGQGGGGGEEDKRSGQSEH